MQVILNSKKRAGCGVKGGYLKGLGYTASVLLAAFAGSALAAGQDLDTLVTPGGYEILDDGRAVFRLADGRTIFLEQDQYVLLEGGLLMVVDEIAQAAFTSLPVMGAIRTELLGSVQPVRDIEGGEILMSDAQPLWSGEGPAPSLFEQVNVVSHELAQNTDSDEQTDTSSGMGAGLGLASVLSGAGLLVLLSPSADAVPPAPAVNSPVPTVIDGVVQVLGDTGAGSGTLETATLSSHVTWSDADNDITTFAVSSSAFTPTLTPETADGMLAGTVDGVSSNGTTSWTSLTSAIKVTVTDAEGNTGTQDLIAAGQLVLPDSAVADAMSVTITGAGADDYLGYNAANAASTSPLTNLGRGIGVTSWTAPEKVVHVLS